MGWLEEAKRPGGSSRHEGRCRGCAATGLGKAFEQDVKGGVVAIPYRIEERPDVVVGFQAVAPLPDDLCIGRRALAFQHRPRMATWRGEAWAV